MKQPSAALPLGQIAVVLDHRGVTDLVSSVSWPDFADQARVFGFNSFADELEAADEAALRRAFDRITKTKPKDTAKVEKLDKARRWTLMQKALLSLTPVQAEMLSSFADGPYHEAVWQCGRRGGKSLLADVLALCDVAVRGDLQRKVRPGEPRVLAIIAPRLDQAESHIRSCADLIQNSRPLRSMLTDASGSGTPHRPCTKAGRTRINHRRRPDG